MKATTLEDTVGIGHDLQANVQFCVMPKHASKIEELTWPRLATMTCDRPLQAARDESAGNQRAYRHHNGLAVFTFDAQIFFSSGMAAISSSPTLTRLHMSHLISAYSAATRRYDITTLIEAPEIGRRHAGASSLAAPPHLAFMLCRRHVLISERHL